MLSRGMKKKPKKQTPEDEPEDKPSRTDEARKVIEEYADDLREVIKKLRKPPQLAAASRGIGSRKVAQRGRGSSANG